MQEKNDFCSEKSFFYRPIVPEEYFTPFVIVLPVTLLGHGSKGNGPD